MFEYYLRQIHRGVEDPLNIDLKLSQIVVGRSTNPELKNYSQVSREHARFKKINNDWFVEDMNSLNGVFVNGNKIGRSPVQLQIGDHIGLGIPSAGEEFDGYVCSLSVRLIKKKIIFVDLCDEPAIKTEPPDDIATSSQSFSYGNSYNNLTNDVKSSYPAIVSTSAVESQNGNFCNKHKNDVNKIKEVIDCEPVVQKIIPKTLKQQNPIIDQFCYKKSTTGFDPFTVNTVESLTRNSNSLIESNVSNRTSEMKNSPNSTTEANFSSRERLTDLPHTSTKTFTSNDKCQNKKQKALSHENDFHRSSAQSSNISIKKVNSDKKQNDEDNSNKYTLPLSEKKIVKDCYVPLVRCDSEYFKLPSDVRSSVINGILSAKKQFFNKTFAKQKNKRKISTSSSSSSDIEEKQTSSKPLMKVKKESDIEASYISPQSSSHAIKSPDQNKYIVNNTKVNTKSEDTFSNGLNQVKTTVSSISDLENKKEPTKLSEPPSIRTIKSVENMEQHNQRNENLLKNVTKKEIDNEDFNILNNIGYSQPDEDGVIVISDDDDDYYDFQSSQVVIKQEPLDDEMELISDEDPFDRIVDPPGILDSEETLTESIENIKRFVESTRATEEKNPSNGLQVSEDVATYLPMSQLNDDDADLELSSTTSKSAKNISAEVIKSSVPAFNRVKISSESESSSDSDSSVSNHSVVLKPSFEKSIKESKEQENKRGVIQKQIDEVKSKSSKSVGRALLIEPQKLNRRPNRLCGRGEWFEDKTSEQAPEPKKSVENKDVKSVTKSKEPSRTKTTSRKRKDSLSTRQSLLNKLQSPKKQVANAVQSHPTRKKQPKSLPTSSGKPVPKVQSPKEQESAKKKNPPISRRPNDYASRSAFLVSDMQPVTAKRKPGNINKNSDKKESNKYSTVRKSAPPAVDKSCKVTNNKEYPLPDISLPSVMNRTLNVGLGNLHRSKTVQAVIVSPPTAASLPSTSKTPAETTIVPHEHFPPRDPRLLRRLNSSDNKLTVNQNYAAHNHTNSINNMTKIMNTNHNSNSFPQRSTNSSNILCHRAGIIANQPQTSSFRSKSSLAVNHHVFANTLNQRHAIPYPNQTKISFNYMVRKIVELKVGWLEEQRQCEIPPPQVLTNATNLPLFFNSVDHYIDSFFPMLMLEVWDNMYQESKLIYENGKKVAKKFWFMISSFEEKKNESKMDVYHCTSLVNEKSFEPSEGNVLMMEVLDRKNQSYTFFAYVFRHRIEDVRRDNISAEWKKQIEKIPDWFANAKLWRFSVYLKIRQISPRLHKLMKGYGICSIRNRIRLADALRSFASSPLSQLIIQPNENDFYQKYSDISPGRDYNYSQMMAIEGIGSEMLKQDPKPKIVLLQGPPGTGKTHTIVGLLDKLTSNPKFRILVVAPSNAAIDEIGSRLLSLIRSNSTSKARIKFVRVGLADQINSKLRSYSLEEQASKLSREYYALLVESKKLENEKLLKQIDELKKQKQDYSTEAKIKFYKEEIKKNEQQIALKSNDSRMRWSFKSQVLKQSNVILSTLGSCGQSILNSCFGPTSRDSFSCCIMDESSQCTETEALLPLMFGINKLIMIGDHQQLPATVNSKFATNFGYARSMFERFHLYFSKHCNMNPIYMLRQQYRMHSEICQFPSEYFYDNLLTTDPHNNIRDEKFPLHPYMVYDIMDSQESDSSNSKTNCSEAHAILDICTQILNYDSHSSIGIITPYSAQRTLYSNALKHNAKYRNIEINTVDGFQGREKDIIIVSCVRANSGTGGIGFLSCPKRLNVAITRARKCLIICVHSKTLVQNEDWRKLIEDARTRGSCISVNSYQDMLLIFNVTLVKKYKPKRRH